LQLIPATLINSKRTNEGGIPNSIIIA
jgi:hypothetical protein